MNHFENGRQKAIQEIKNSFNSSIYPDVTQRQYDEDRGWRDAKAGKPKENNAPKAYIEGYDQYLLVKKRGLLNSKYKEKKEINFMSCNIRIVEDDNGTFSWKATSNGREIAKGNNFPSMDSAKSNAIEEVKKITY